MRIAIVHDWEPNAFQEFTWKDGLCAAIRELSKRHGVRFFTVGDREWIMPHEYFSIFFTNHMEQSVRDFEPDVILHWADTTRPNAEVTARIGKPQALCFAGGDTHNATHQYFDHFFVESDSYKTRYEVRGDSVSTAFGTNTDIFQPQDCAKTFDIIFPSTYCEWKRHNLLIEANRELGLSVVTAGFKYEVHERDVWENCMKAGFLTLPHVSAEALRDLYAASKVCVVPSRNDGGSQRTVLEAMAMNIPIVCCADSDKTSEYVNEGNKLFGFVGIVAEPNARSLGDAMRKSLDIRGTCRGRDYVNSRWTHHHYASALEEGLLKLCQKNTNITST